MLICHFDKDLQFTVKGEGPEAAQHGLDILLGAQGDFIVSLALFHRERTALSVEL